MAVGKILFVYVNIWRISRTQSSIMHVLRMSLTCLIHTCFASKLVTNLRLVLMA